jgi:ATP/maltotriose-dependent transcriptional regulator MalT
MLPAYIEIILAAKNIGATRVAADELSKIANGMDIPFVHGIAARGQGAVLLAEGKARAALEALRNAAESWEELEVPYEVARLRVLVGLAYKEIGNGAGAEMEFDAARRTFQQLGAAPDEVGLKMLTKTSAPETTSGLTAREVQVLALAASGKTNREIATELVISERTVARHMSNIFTKLNVSSRTAATVFAFEHSLVKPRHGQN